MGPLENQTRGFPVWNEHGYQCTFVADQPHGGFGAPRVRASTGQPVEWLERGRYRVGGMVFTSSHPNCV
jgi:hypothetical protein